MGKLKGKEYVRKRAGEEIGNCKEGRRKGRKNAMKKDERDGRKIYGKSD